MFTKQKCKELIIKKLEEGQIIARKDLIHIGRNNAEFDYTRFGIIESVVNATLKELVDMKVLIKRERGIYIKA